MKFTQPHRRIALGLSTSVALAAAVSPAFGDLNAFPGAVGFGANTTGARASSTPTIVVVNTLNDDPNGAVAGQTTLRDALGGSNRIVVFAVSGYVNLNSTAISAKSNLTILGQTAPGQGLSTMGAEISFTNQNNDILQYFRTREGSIDSNFKDSINMGNTTNMILDHMSVEFAQYDNIDDVYSKTGGAGVYQNISTTIQNSIIADPIPGQQFNIHQEGSSITYINNIWANAHNRNPLAKGDTQFVNNTVYNYQGGYTTGNSAGTYKYDIINNYFIAGPSTTSASNAFYQLDSNQSAYLLGNLLDSNKDGSLNGSNLTTADGAILLSTYYAPGTQFLPTLDATSSVAFNLLHAGAAYRNANGTFSRDQVDTQIDAQVASNGTQGSILNSETGTGLSNGGFGDLGNVSIVGNAAYFDTVPLTWISAHGIAATTAGLLTKNPLGYYMIEQYAQEVGDQYGSMITTGGDLSTISYPASSPALYTHLLIRGTGTANGIATLATSENASAFNISLGGNGPAPGETLNVSGGNLTVQDTITIGDQNNASLNFSSGVIRTDNIQLGNTVYNANGSLAANYTGNLNMTGGTLQVTNIVQGAGTPGNYTSGGSINWSGGTIEAFGNLTISAPIVLSGNATVNTLGPDSVAYAGLISSKITGAGNFIKTGAGTLTLSNNNTFSGNITISGGALLAASNNAFSNGTIFANAVSGLQLASGVTLSNPIIASAGANEFEDFTGTGSATIAGPISGVGSQFRVGISGTTGTLTFTGATTTSVGIVLVTRGNITYASNGSLVSNNSSVIIGRGGNTSSANLSLTGNALVQGPGITLGGLNGTSDSIATTVTVAGNATLSAGTSSVDLSNNDTAGTTALTLNGGTLNTGAFTMTGSNHGAVTVTFNGGTLLASAGDASNPFFPALGAGTTNPVVAKISTGGLLLNDGGFAITIAQPLTNASGTDGGLTKIGNGTLALTGANTYNGTTNVSNGTLKLDFASTTTPNILLSTGAVSLAGGTTFVVNGNASTAASQTLGSLNFGTGLSNVSLTNPGAGLTLTLTNITRANGSSALLSIPAGAQINTPLGIASSPLVVGNSDIGLIAGDWAAKDPSNTFIVPGGSISGFYTPNPLDGPNTSVTLAGNIDMVTPTASDLANQTRLAGNNFIGVVRFNTAGNFSITVKPGAFLGTNGILVTPAAGAGTFNIDNVRSDGTGDLTVWQNDTASPLTLGSIGNNGSTSLNKQGPGTLVILNGGSYTGQTYLNGGTTSVSQNAALGDPATGAAINLNGGTLQATASFALSNGAPGTNDRPVSVGPFNGAIDVTAGNTLTVAGIVSGSGNLTKTGPGALALNGANTLVGNVAVSAGGLYLNNAAGIGSGNLTLASGTTLGGTGSLPGNVTLPTNLNYTLNPGSSAPGVAAGTLTLKTLSTNANTTLLLDLPLRGAAPLLNVTGTTTLAGGTMAIHSLASSGAASLGYYRILDYTGALPNAASLTLPTATNNIVYTLDTTHDAGIIDLHRGYIGDANDDGIVDLNDLNTVLNNLGTTASSWTAGNFDGAATIDLNDLNSVLNNLGTSVPANAISQAEALTASASAPEPASLSLMAASALLLIQRRRSAAPGK